MAESFRKDVVNKGGQLDPDNEEDWFALSHGYFIAKGANAKEARALSRFVRYDMKYWNGSNPQMENAWKLFVRQVTRQRQSATADGLTT
jgi:hypothetical protein